MNRLASWLERFVTQPRYQQLRTASHGAPLRRQFRMKLRSEQDVFTFLANLLSILSWPPKPGRLPDVRVTSYEELLTAFRSMPMPEILHLDLVEGSVISLAFEGRIGLTFLRRRGLFNKTWTFLLYSMGDVPNTRVVERHTRVYTAIMSLLYAIVKDQRASGSIFVSEECQKAFANIERGLPPFYMPPPHVVTSNCE